MTIVSSTTTYIEDGAAIGQDTTIEPFSFIGRDAAIGCDCIVGPFAMVPRQSIIAEGTVVAGNVTPETAMLQMAS